MITIDDFKKLDLRVGKIISAERVSGSEKLLKLEIDLGEEPRQIIAGIAKQYTPEEMIAKEVVIIANLEPRKFTLRLGSGQVSLESQGMLLCADCDGAPIFLQPEKSVPVGTKIK